MASPPPHLKARVGVSLEAQVRMFAVLVVRQPPAGF